MKITSLGYALLGLLSNEDSSGYALRRMFETTPFAAFSSSPGSVYPALNNLVKLKLIEKVSIKSNNKGLYRITEHGEKTLIAWLSEEVSFDEVEKNPHLVILRFSFLESAQQPLLTLKFLESFRRVLREHLSNLNRFMSSPEGDGLSVYGRLSMESGISQYEAYRQWVNLAIKTVKKTENI